MYLERFFDEEFINHNLNAEISMENAYLKLMKQLFYLTQLSELISQNSPI